MVRVKGKLYQEEEKPQEAWAEESWVWGANLWRMDKKESWCRRHSSTSRSRNWREGGRLLMEDNVGQGHIAMDIWEVYMITIMCARIVDKDPLKSTRGEFKERRGGVLDENCTFKDTRRE